MYLIKVPNCNLRSDSLRNAAFQRVEYSNTEFPKYVEPQKLFLANDHCSKVISNMESTSFCYLISIINQTGIERGEKSKHWFDESPQLQDSCSAGR
jgi:hypothetical protein